MNKKKIKPINQLPIKVTRQELIERHLALVFSMMDALVNHELDHTKAGFEVYQALGQVWDKYGGLCKHPRREWTSNEIYKKYRRCLICGAVDHCVPRKKSHV